MGQKVIGLTGGIACGKTTAARLLAELGWKIIDTDDLAHAVVEPGEEGWKQVQDKFGSTVFNADQTLNRKKLAEMVFNEPSKLAQLNALLHPLIQERWKTQMAGLSTQGHSVIVVIPLLYEIGVEKDFEKVAVVGCSEKIAWQRAQDRGWSEAHFQARLRGQWPLEKKVALAEFVIWNEGSLNLLQQQIQQLHQKLVN